MLGKKGMDGPTLIKIIFAVALGVVLIMAFYGPTNQAVKDN